MRGNSVVYEKLKSFYILKNKCPDKHTNLYY